MAQVHFVVAEGKPELHSVGISSLSACGCEVNEFLRRDFLQFLVCQSSHSLDPFIRCSYRHFVDAFFSVGDEG